jgi:general secretion pathway protein L
VAEDIVTRYRVRASHATAETGVFAWAELNAAGTVLQINSSDVAAPPEPGACDLVIPADAVVLQRIRVPKAQRQRLADNLRFLVEDLVACDVERVHVAEVAASGDEICVAIVDRAWLAAVLARIAGTGLRAQRAIAETLLPPTAPGEWTVVWQGEESFVRTSAGAGFALDNPGREAVPSALRLAVDAAPPARIVVRSADASVPDLAGWSEALGVPVQAGASWSWAGSSLGDAPDLLQGEFAPGSDDQRWRARLRVPAFLAAALVLLASAGLAVDWTLKASERRALLAEMQSLYRETFGASAVVVDAPLQMQRALTELRRRHGDPAPGDFLPLLDVAADKILDAARQKIQAVSYQNGRLVITLAPVEPAGFGTLVEGLRAKASIPGHDVRIETVIEKGAPQVRVTVRVESGKWALAKP